MNAAARFLARADPALARIIRKVGPPRLRPELRVHPFEALAEAIVHQQLHGKAAAAIWGRVRALFPPGRRLDPAAVLAATAPSLRGAGLSGAKAAALQDLARKTLSGVVPDARRIAALTDAEIVERLTVIRGVGPWTVEMLLIFKLGRPDVLPATDYGVRAGFAAAFDWEKLPTPRQVLDHGERWRPHRSTAAWYLWRALELFRARPDSRSHPRTGRVLNTTLKRRGSAGV